MPVYSSGSKRPSTRADHPTQVAVQRWQAALRKGNNDRVTLAVFPGVGHGIRMRGVPTGSGPAPFAHGYADVRLGWLWQRRRSISTAFTGRTGSSSGECSRTWGPPRSASGSIRSAAFAAANTQTERVRYFLAHFPPGLGRLGASTLTWLSPGVGTVGFVAACTARAAR